MSKRATDAALKALPDYSPDGKHKADLTLDRLLYQRAYEQAEKEFAEAIKTAEDHAYFAGSESMREKVISLIESRIGEILGDAQPAPVLRTELRELINKIKEK